MIVFLNGRFVLEDQALVSVSDRGFLLGDGLFETLPVYGGRPFCWSQHFARLETGARLLGITLPFASEELARHAAELIDRNACRETMLRITLTRGSGMRGYSPRSAGPATLVMTLHPTAPSETGTMPRWRLITSSHRVVVGDPLAACKHTSRLLNVLARAEAEAHGADEALLLNTAGEIAEAASGNVFWIRNGIVRTPPVASGALAGITRSLVLGVCMRLGITTAVQPLRPEELADADGAFVTMSSLGMVEVAAVDGRELAVSETTVRLRAAWADVVTRFRRGEPEDLTALVAFPPPA